MKQLLRPAAILLGLSLLLAACGKLAPANVPPQLDYTPGPPVFIAEGRYHSVAFTVKIPPGWQIVTSPVTSPPWVVFISPDEDAVMVVAVDEQDTLNLQPNHIEGELLREAERVELDDGSELHTALIVGDAVLNDYMAAFQQLVGSIILPAG